MCLKYFGARLASWGDLDHFLVSPKMTFQQVVVEGPPTFRSA
jgi:hypothetical protein